MQSPTLLFVNAQRTETRSSITRQVGVCASISVNSARPRPRNFPFAAKANQTSAVRNSSRFTLTRPSRTTSSVHNHNHGRGSKDGGTPIARLQAGPEAGFLVSRSNCSGALQISDFNCRPSHVITFLRKEHLPPTRPASRSPSASPSSISETTCGTCTTSRSPRSGHTSSSSPSPSATRTRARGIARSH